MWQRILIISFGFLIQSWTAANAESAHMFTFQSIEGEHISLSDYTGKAILVVNTASRCGFTQQYNGLQSLWEKYRENGLIVLGVPSNDFGGQEPGTEKEIKNFCKVNFNISFPMTKKTRVKGEKAHPFFLWATEQLGTLSKPRWNFYKFLINKQGKPVDWFASSTSPTSPKLISAVERVLSEED